MSTTAIKVENLSKRYRIGLKEEMHDNFVGAIVDLVKRPVKNLHRLRKLSTFGEDSHEPEDIMWALKDVSFEVERGEVIGIIGRNGAGKSTLLKILARITEPTKGRAITKGRVGSLLEVGTGFHPELTGRENIYLNGTILGMKKAEVNRKFDEIVDFSDVEKFIDTPVKRYSTGMKVRLAFAVAAHLEPEILLVDEVLAVGDTEFQRKCLGKMHEVTGEGRTVLFVSHSMPSIEALCHRAVLLEDGQITFRGDSADTVAYYLGKKGLTVSSYTNLRTHPGRMTKTRPIFQSIRILNQWEEETTAIQLGDAVVFEIVLEATERKLKSPRIQIHVLDSRETSVCRFVSDLMMVKPAEIAGWSLVRCYWKACRLTPGVYSVNLHIRNDGISLDKIIDAVAIEVHSSDVYGTGKLDTAAGLIIPEGRWEFKPLPKSHQRVGDSE